MSANRNFDISWQNPFLTPIMKSFVYSTKSVSRTISCPCFNPPKEVPFGISIREHTSRTRRGGVSIPRGGTVHFDMFRILPCADSYEAF